PAGKDAQGRDIWVPVQAASGRQSIQIEGTPDPNAPGGFDNERPRKVTRGANGEEVKVEPLSAAEMKDWRESRERSRNPGGLTDADVAARKPGTVDVPVQVGGKNLVKRTITDPA